ncbi:MAG: PLP-dependent aminotransferase family protein [Bacillota bacterium]
MNIEWNQFFSNRAGNIKGSQIRQFFALTERPEVISFAGGFPGNEFFPQEDISQSLSEMVMEDSRQSLQYSPTEGSYELRMLLAQKMNREGGGYCGAGNLLVTDGSQQGLDLLSRILINPGDPVLVEEPAYIGGISAFKSCGGQPVGIDMDEEGVIPSKMEQSIKELAEKGQKPRLFYTVPNFQNPTGITTSLKRRYEILALASQYNLVIIEDNPYGDLCYDGVVPINYKALDREERVVYLGSFSKVLIPGIRIGWLAGSRQLIEKITLAKQSADLCSGSLGQQLAYKLTRDGYVGRHTKKLRHLYREKRDAMINAMEKYFPVSVSFNKPGGGFFIWVVFPTYYPNSKELLDLALQRNVAFVHGEGFSSNGSGKKCARFSFSQPCLEDIVTGIKTLGEIFQEIESEAILKTANCR